MMNFSADTLCDSHSIKENIPPASKTDASQVQRARQRTVLGILSDNEQRGRSLSKASETWPGESHPGYQRAAAQRVLPELNHEPTPLSPQGGHLSKHSSVSGSSQRTFLGRTSSSSYDVFVEEACEVVLAPSGQEVVSESYYLDTDLQNEDLKLLLELSSSSLQDASVESEPDKCLMSEQALSVSEYAADIHRHLREREMKFRPVPRYLERHPEITSGMRVVLVDWLVEVVQEYTLSSETLHLAVNYLDRFLSGTTSLKRNKLQLVGTASLLIASKYEEIFPPELNDFVYITDSTYTKRQLVQMEHVLLRVLAFNLAAPTANQFLCLFMSVHCVCANTESLALYITELSLLEIELFLQYTPSIVAAGAYCLATYTVDKSLWPDSLYALTGYTMDEIVPCMTDLHKLHISAGGSPQQAIREKYKSSKYCRVSWITPPALLPFL